ncbi:MAG: hypothetical protein JWM80_6109 [Cyanobacteria bacterium RYN_339]|nr:hypothetical protein [Cyanobacteria bacterium RYN_339]
MPTRDHLHHLVDTLPEGKIQAAERLFLLLVAEDSLPPASTPDEIAALRAELALLRAGGPTLDEVMRAEEPSMSGQDFLEHLRARDAARNASP